LKTEKEIKKAIKIMENEKYPDLFKERVLTLKWVLA